MNVRYIALMALLVGVTVRAMEEDFDSSSSDSDFEFTYEKFGFSPGSDRIYIARDPDMNPDIAQNMLVWELLKEQRKTTKEQRKTNKHLADIANLLVISHSLSSESNEEEPKEESSPSPPTEKRKSIGTRFKKLKIKFS